MRTRSAISIIISITLVMIILGSLGILLISGKRLGNYVREHILLSVVLEDNIKEVEIRQLEKILIASDFVKESEYVTKEEAEKRLEEELGIEFSKVLDFNPLLASINLKLHPIYAQTDSVTKIEKELLNYQGVKKVYYKKDLLESVNENLQKIMLTLVTVSILLVLISFTLISSTIRLAIYSQRFIINTMQIVGATDHFVRRPFIRDGLLKGFFSGLLASFVLAMLIYLLPEDFSLLISIRDLHFIGLLIIIILLSLLFSWFATYVSVSHYLRKQGTNLYR